MGGGEARKEPAGAPLLAGRREPEPVTIYTIGHSNLAVETLVARLREHGIEVLVDVRTHPHSAYNPQFNQPALRQAVEAVGIGYRFAGRELGGKPDDPGLRGADGTPDYGKIAATRDYRDGIEGLLALAADCRVALMCSEGDPAHCHREKLIAPTLREREVEVLHILPDGSAGTGPQPALW